MSKFKFSYCDIEINEDISMSGGTMLKFTEKADNEGNILEPVDRPTFVHELDNYQAYELAMAILKNIDVDDTRGSK